jgi:hypothetical protein
MGATQKVWSKRFMLLGFEFDEGWNWTHRHLELPRGQRNAMPLNVCGDAGGPIEIEVEFMFGSGERSCDRTAGSP